MAPVKNDNQIVAGKSKWILKKKSASHGLTKTKKENLQGYKVGDYAEKCGKMRLGS